MEEKKEKRIKSVKIRLTENEYHQLMIRKVGTLSDWMRKTCLSEDIQVIDKTCDPELLYQLAKIGGNLNQIAKHLNGAENEIRKISAFTELAHIRNLLDGLLEMNIEDTKYDS